MNLATGPAAESTRAARPPMIERVGALLAALAVLLVAVGLGLRWIESTGTDLPPETSLARDFEAAALAVERLELEAGAPASGARLWSDLWIACNGQYDARLLATAALLLQVLALAAVLLAMQRRLPAGGFLVFVLLAVAMFAARSGAGPRPVGEAAWSAILVTLSVGQVILMGPSPLAGWRFAGGLVCGVANILAGPEGIASSLAVAAWHALMVAREPASWPARRTVVVAAGALAAGGIVLALVAGRSEVPVASYFAAFGALAAWPWRSPAWAVIMWAPAIFCLVRVLGGDTRRAPVAPTALLAIALVTVAAPRCAAAGAAAEGIGLFGLLANAACVVCWWTTSRRSAESRLVLGTVWMGAVFLGLTHGGAPRSPVPVGASVRDPATLAIREAVVAGRDDDRVAWSDPRIRRILPPSVRAPLAWDGAVDPAWSAGVPELVGQDGLPAVGTWIEGGSTTTGEWVSGPMTAALPLLEVRMCGRLRPPATEVVLRTADGTEVQPWTRTAESTDRWKRVNFGAPRGPFHLVVRDRDPAAWIAVAAPVEVGRLTWLVRKLPVIAPWAMLAGAVAALGAGIGGARLARRAHAAWVERGAPMFPWHFVTGLAFICVALFLGANLDTTAGPNDSGGYLNSAKLLASGRIAAEPRAIPTADGPLLDPELVLPITFSVAPDGRMAPEYPVGFPLIVATFALVMPIERAVGCVVWLHLIVGVVATGWLARIAGLPPAWSRFAAAIIGLSPLYIFQAIQPMSDVVALVWLTLAMVWAWKCRENARWCIPAGLAMALAVLIRPSNVLGVLPALVCLTGRWRQLATWALAGLPAAVWLAWYQNRLYGDPFVTGYGSVPTMFGLRHLVPTLRAYAHDLPLLFSPVIVLALAGPFVRPAPGRLRLMLAAWVAAFLAFYSVYWCTWDNGMRFLLPAAPAMVVLVLLALRGLGERLRLEFFSTRSFWRGCVPTLVLVASVLGWLVGVGMAHRVLFWPQANREHAVVAKWARDHLPPDAVVFAKHASGSLAFYTDLLVVRIDRGPVQAPGFIESIARTGRPVHAVTYHWEAPDYDPDRGGRGSGRPALPGHWERIASLWDDHAMVWTWRPETPGNASTEPD